MRFKEFLLLEMTTKIASIETNSRTLYIEIRTGNIGAYSSGISEHFPAHIHVISGSQVDIPLKIEDTEIMGTKGHKPIGILSKEDLAYINDFLNYYGRDNLIKIFNSAMKSQDPEILFKQLKLKVDKQWSTQHEESKNFGYQRKRKKGRNQIFRH